MGIRNIPFRFFLVAAFTTELAVLMTPIVNPLSGDFLIFLYALYSAGNAVRCPPPDLNFPLLRLASSDYAAFFFPTLTAPYPSSFTLLCLR